MSASSLPSGRLANSLAANSSAQAGTMSLWQLLKMCGSLKITVVMFFLAIWLVLFGTLAQDEQNLSEVKAEYFNSFVAVVPLDVLFPQTIFPHKTPVPFGFLFPGGATIGLVLMVNLIAAKLTRFHVSAKGARLVGGVIMSLLGAGLVVAVIVAGNRAEGLQGKPPIEYATLWNWVRAAICLLTAGAVVAALFPRKLPALARIALWVTASLMVLLSVFLVAGGESVKLDDPGLRIVWQLLQSSVAAMVVLVGLWMVFGNRGGNVLIHIGVALLMLGQFIFGDRQVEQRMTLLEGQQTNLVYRQNELELAVIDTSDPAEDKVIAVPESRLQRSAKNKSVIDVPELPVKLKVLEWMANSNYDEIKPDADKSAALPATVGIGLLVKAKPIAPNGGASSRVNVASAYVEVIDKKSNESLGVFLVSQFFNDQKQLILTAPGDQNESLTIDGKPYELALRFRREYKPYQVYLEDVQRVNYAVSDRPRDYSSHVVIRDMSDGSELKGHIWMNNPVRYRNESFYQSEHRAFRLNGQEVELTGLQVVANQGWVIPYVACMLVLLGMTSHFGGIFLRFASRFERGAIPTAGSLESAKPISFTRLALNVTAVALFACVTVIYAAMPPRSKSTAMDWYQAGKIPVLHEGRVKPLDTVARNILQVIGEPLFGGTPRPKDTTGQRHSGTEWLLALMADKEWPADSPIFRIYSQEARDYFGLEQREGYLYSYNQLKDKSRELSELLANKEELSKEDEQLAKIYRKMQLYDIVTFSYKLPPLPNEADFTDSEEDRRRFGSQLMNIMEFERRIEAANPPAVIPPEAPVDGSVDGQAEGKWQAFSPAIFTNYITQKLGMRAGGANPAILKFTDVLDAVRENDAMKFNSSTDEYLKYVATLPNVKPQASKASVESWLNHFGPTNWGVALYLIAFLMGMVSISFASSSKTFRWGTFALILVTFLVHTIAIISRIYISGRPPVVNLYSSAVFIGWAVVLASMILELVYPLGICNLSAALIGACTLSIARSLDSSDTMHVLDAVLDTQFWLSTHVVTVTLGYGATFLAGMFGIFALILRVRSGVDRLPPEKVSPKATMKLQILNRIIYGVLCFAILLSFVGTVLGGLWADDSWGRFWGWDPKENGALMIVLWNALVLHANWDRIVGPRGLAALAVLGNIVTSWSWFGTNQLNIGLHSYGFTEAVLATLVAVVVLHLLFVGITLLLTIPRKAAQHA